MKKRIGILHGKPIVIGDKNLVTDNEIYLSSSGTSNNLTIICIMVDGYGIQNVTINGKEYEYFMNDGTFAIRDKELFESIINNKYNVRLILEEHYNFVGTENNIIIRESIALMLTENNVSFAFSDLGGGNSVMEIHK